MRLLNYFHPLSNLERQRKKIAVNSLPEPLKALIQFPIYRPEVSLESLEFLVVDFETSGFDIHHDAILSIGWVVIKNNQINLDSAQKINILAANQIKASTAVINHIVPETLIDATPVASAMQSLLKAMSNRILIAHSVPIERGFLNQYCLYHFNAKLPPLVWLDTLAMEGSMLGWSPYRHLQECGLSAIRKKYGLPCYPAHDALIDAVATAELFLAQIRAIYGYQRATLGALMKRSFHNF